VHVLVLKLSDLATCTVQIQSRRTDVYFRSFCPFQYMSYLKLLDRFRWYMALECRV